ncbi:MAG: helix-turn-helix domain-containing protein [Dermatophilaceae bacterium]
MSAFQDYLHERLKEPRVRAGYEDHKALQGVIDKLVGFRRALGLTQGEVARRMGVKQPTVSGFETEMSDPRLSTLQRYARAVEAHIEVSVRWDAGCDWVTPAVRASRYEPAGDLPAPHFQEPTSSDLVRAWPERHLAQPPYELACT